MTTYLIFLIRYTYIILLNKYEVLLSGSVGSRLYAAFTFSKYFNRGLHYVESAFILLDMIGVLPIRP